MAASAIDLLAHRVREPAGALVLLHALGLGRPGVRARAARMAGDAHAQRRGPRLKSQLRPAGPCAPGPASVPARILAASSFDSSRSVVPSSNSITGSLR